MDVTQNPGRNPRLVFLVIASGGLLFKTLRMAQKLTWVRDLQEPNRIFFLEGNSLLPGKSHTRYDLYDTSRFGENPFLEIKPAYLKSKRTLLVDSTGGWDQILSNTISGMQWVEDNLEYDFLIRTNISSYWNIPAVNKLLTKTKNVDYYLGNVTTNLGSTYVEGDGIVLSQSTVSALLKNKHALDTKIIDDVSIGMALNSIGIKPINLPRPWFRSPITLMGFNKTQLEDAISIRCKAEFSKLGLTVRLDWILMWILRKRLSNK